MCVILISSLRHWLTVIPFCLQVFADCYQILRLQDVAMTALLNIFTECGFSGLATYRGLAAAPNPSLMRTALIRQVAFAAGREMVESEDFANLQTVPGVSEEVMKTLLDMQVKGKEDWKPEDYDDFMVEEQ